MAIIPAQAAKLVDIFIESGKQLEQKGKFKQAPVQSTTKKTQFEFEETQKKRASSKNKFKKASKQANEQNHTEVKLFN